MDYDTQVGQEALATVSRHSYIPQLIYRETSVKRRPNRWTFMAKGSQKIKLGPTNVFCLDLPVDQLPSTTTNYCKSLFGRRSVMSCFVDFERDDHLNID